MTNFRIENLEGLKDSTLRLGDFTILSGENPVAQSCVMKLLYGLFEAQRDGGEMKARCMRMRTVFQFNAFDFLQRDPDLPLTVSIDGNEALRLNGMAMELNLEGIDWTLFNHNYLYLESPSDWRWRGVADSLLTMPNFTPDYNVLAGVPYHLSNLSAMLRNEPMQDIQFPDLFGRLTGDKLLNGQIGLETSCFPGEIYFERGGKKLPLAMVSTGEINLGMLAFLIKRVFIREQTMLFIDEPEAGLSPSWQIALGEILFALAKGGVKVVIATHSSEMVKLFEVLVKEKPEDEKLVALNHFSDKGIEGYDGDFENGMYAIKESLLRPFSDLRMRDLML